MAHLLAKLGEAALKPRKVGDIWYKAAISAKNAARLRREWLLQGKEWPFEKERKEVKPRKPKGHKHDRLKPQREKAIEVKLANMEERVAEYRKSKANQLQNASLLDRLLTPPKQLRLKLRGGTLLPTHPTDWDPSCIPPPLNVRLDGCIVPSEASPQGARIAFSQLVVMDDLIDEAQRAELLHFLTAPPGEDQGPGHRASPTELGEHRVGREGAQLDAGTGQRDSMARMAAATPAQPGVCGGTPAPPPPLALPPHKWERRTTDMAGAAPSWGVRPAVLAELARMELPAMREVHARLCKLLPSFHIALLPSESIQVGGAGGHDHPQQHHPRQQGADPGSCCQGAVSSPPAPSPSVDCNAFVANAAMAGDTFAWHVDADPTSFPSPSPWLDAFGDYFNGEPGKPLLVSLMLYLNPEWEREWGAETLFMDSATDSGIFVIPRPRRAVLFHQDILHRVSPPSAAAAGRPRFSLVWKLALLPKGEAHSDSAAAPEPRPAALAGAGASGGATELGEAGQEVGLRQMAGSNRGGVTSRLVGGRGERVDGGWPGITPPGCEPPASFGSAARVDAVMRQLAGERKRSRQERG